MSDSTVDRLTEALAAYRVTVGVGRASADTHNRLAPRTYHAIGQRVVILDWPNGEPPTQQQYNGADAIIQSFDWRQRRPRSIAAIVTDLQALSAAEFKLVVCKWLAKELREEPRLLEKLGTNIPGDEAGK